MSVVSVQLPFPTATLALKADCLADLDGGPLVSLRDCNGAPILTLGVVEGAYRLHIAPTVAVSEDRL